VDLRLARIYDEKYLTKEQAANIVGLHPKTIEREIQRGNLRAFKPAGKIRIHPDDLTAWLASSAVAPSVHAI
jgi:excisionase family DNA binding protein